MSEFKIRPTRESDLAGIKNTVSAAFGETGQEVQENTQLVVDLLDDPSAEPILSLAAFRDGEIVGHILFSRVGISGAPPELAASILAPLAVHPDQQGKGVGGALIREGLRQLKESGCELVFVLGHPEYYPRFGFNPAGVEGFEAPYPIAPEHAEAWMVQALRPGILGEVSGKVLLSQTLDDPKHW